MSTEKKNFIAVKFDRVEIQEIEKQGNINFADLGLPSGRKWALRNVGAESEEDCGFLMDFDTANTIQFEDGWHLPTKEDFIELDENCAHKWIVNNGVPGMLFTSIHNGNSIFLPAAGYSWFDKTDDDEYGTTLKYRGSVGNYWSSSYNSATNAYSLNFNSSEVIPQDYSYRGYGFTGRAVQ